MRQGRRRVEDKEAVVRVDSSIIFSRGLVVVRQLGNKRIYIEGGIEQAADQLLQSLTTSRTRGISGEWRAEADDSLARQSISTCLHGIVLFHLSIELRFYPLRSLGLHSATRKEIGTRTYR